MMNAFFSGQLAGMPAIYEIESGDCQVIRPLYAIAEDTIETFVQAQNWPIVPCTLCGSQDGMKRQEIKQLLKDLQGKYPDLKTTLFGSLHHPDPRFLYDQGLWDGDVPSIKQSV